MTGREILVTGGAGFIGSHLTNALIEAGNSVTVLDNLSTGDKNVVHPEAEFIHGDVRDDEALDRAFSRGPEAVCHIAGQASIRVANADPGVDLGVNVTGTLKVLGHCRSNRVPRLVFASSMTIYGNPADVPTPETAAPDPVSFYGVTKYSAERYVQLMGAQSDRDAPLDVTSLRMFNVFGPGQSLANPYQGVLAIFVGNVMRDEPITIFGDGEQSRDFVYVADVVRAWQQILDEPRSFGRVFNVGSGNPVSVNALCDAVLSEFGHTRTSYPVKSAPAQLGDVRASAAEIAQIRHVVGWQPEVSFSQGMKKTVAWARQSSVRAR